MSWSEHCWCWLADRLPARLVYWTGVRLWTYACRDPEPPRVATSLAVATCLTRWEAGHGAGPKGDA